MIVTWKVDGNHHITPARIIGQEAQTVNFNHTFSVDVYMEKLNNGNLNKQIQYISKMTSFDVQTVEEMNTITLFEMDLAEVANLIKMPHTYYDTWLLVNQQNKVADKL